MRASLRLRLLGSTLLIGAAVGAAPAFAQEPVATSQDQGPAAQPAQNDPQGGEIIVTGSRIPRPSVDNAQPTATVDAATLTNRAYPDIARALSEMPGFGIPDGSAVGGQGSGFGVGQAFVNLYNLGSQRTLTLVNGRRFVGANPATIFSQAGAGTQVDLNTIPTKLIQRIETVSIGGAPVYGSDAIAGTVNIILKQDYSGFDVDGQAGISQRGDLGNQRVRALIGHNFGDGRGNITVNAEYNHDDGLLGNRRSIVAQQLGFIAPLTSSNFDQVLIQNQRTYLGTSGGVAFIRDAARLTGASAIRNSAGQVVAFDRSGNLSPFNVGTPTTDPTTFLGSGPIDVGGAI